MNQKIEYENYLEDVQGLFPMPKIMSEISKRIRSDDTTLDDLAELMMTDATLVSGIVKLSNSSYFGFAEKSESLEESMQRIGFREIARLVGVCMATEVYQAELRHYRIPPEVFWESGIAAALLAERLAEKLKLDGESAYLAGLMRECGMLVINYALSMEGYTEVWDHLEPVQAWERQVCGCDHMEVGARLLELWGFPDTIGKVVAGQWGAGERVGGLVGVLDLVNALLAKCGCDFSTRVQDFSVFSESMAALGLDEAKVEASLTESAERWRKLRGGVLER